MASKSKDARRCVALECSECKKTRKVSNENYFVEKNTHNTTEKLNLSKYCPTCRKHTEHIEKK